MVALLPAKTLPYSRLAQLVIQEFPIFFFFFSGGKPIYLLSSLEKQAHLTDCCTLQTDSIWYTYLRSVYGQQLMPHSPYRVCNCWRFISQQGRLCSYTRRWLTRNCCTGSSSPRGTIARIYIIPGIPYDILDYRTKNIPQVTLSISVDMWLVPAGARRSLLVTRFKL